MNADTPPTRDHRVTRYCNSRHERMVLIEWLGGFAQGTFMMDTQTWDIVITQPQELPDDLRERPAGRYTQVTDEQAEHEGDVAFIASILHARMNLGRQRVGSLRP